MAAIAPVDPGLQAQRTALAWSRTGLALLVNALIVLRAGLVSAQTAVVVLGSILAVASMMGVACGQWRARRLGAGDPRAAPLLLMGTTVGIAWVACIAGVVSIVATLERI